MTLTIQLAIWLACVVPGFVVQVVLSFRTFGRLQVLRTVVADNDLVAATAILFCTQIIGTASWSVALAIGLAALFDTNTSPPVGITLIGQLIVVGLLSFIGLLAFQTVFGFIAGEQLEKRTRDRLAKD